MNGNNGRCEGDRFLDAVRGQIERIRSISQKTGIAPTAKARWRCKKSVGRHDDFIPGTNPGRFSAISRAAVPVEQASP